MKVYLVLLISGCLLPLLARGSEISTWTSLMGTLGGEHRCEKASTSELSLLNSHCEYGTLWSGVGETAKEIDAIIEKTVVQEVALRSHESARCQLYLFRSKEDSFSRGPESRLNQQIENTATAVIRDIRPTLDLLYRERKKLRAERRAQNDKFGVRAFNGGLNSEELEAKGQLANRFAENEMAAQALLKQIPLANREVVYDSLFHAFENGKNSEADLMQAYHSSVKVFREQLENSNSYFKERRDRGGSYQMESKDIAAMVKSNQIGTFIDTFDENSVLKKGLMCRLQSRYLTGPFVADVGGTAILTLAGGAGLWGRVLLGARGLQGASVAARTGYAGLGLLSATAGGMATTLSGKATIEQCWPPNFIADVASTKNCSPESETKGVLTEANVAACAASILMTATPGLTALKGLHHTFKGFLGQVKDYNQLKEIAKTGSAEYAASGSAQNVLARMNAVFNNPAQPSLFRGMKLTPDELRDVLKKGMDPSKSEYPRLYFSPSFKDSQMFSYTTKPGQLQVIFSVRKNATGMELRPNEFFATEQKINPKDILDVFVYDPAMQGLPFPYRRFDPARW